MEEPGWSQQTNCIVSRKDSEASELKAIAIKNGMIPMIEDGFSKATQGLTTVEDVLRVVRE